MNKTPLVPVPLRGAYRSNRFIHFFFLNSSSSLSLTISAYLTAMSLLVYIKPAPVPTIWSGGVSKKNCSPCRREENTVWPFLHISFLVRYTHDAHFQDEAEIPRSTIRQKISPVDLPPYVSGTSLSFSFIVLTDWLLSLQMNLRSTRENQERTNDRKGLPFFRSNVRCSKSPLHLLI